MTDEMDPKVADLLAKTSEEITEKLKSRLEEKWPEYRETESADKRREILVSQQRRLATRGARAWLPMAGDRELREVEGLLFGYLDKVHAPEGAAADMDDDTAHRVAVQGLVFLGNALATVLRAIQGGNYESRMAAVHWIRDAVERGDSPEVVLERSMTYEGPSTGGQEDHNDVMD
jgi:hypothetical protein